MKRSFRQFAARLAGVIIAAKLLVAPDAALSAGASRVVNVTSDSEKGWIPSEDLDQQAQHAAMQYLADMDSGSYAKAYAFLADIDRKDQPFLAYSERLRDFNKRAGRVIDRHITIVTWTKNPAHAPLPGIYAALDLVSTFSNIDRHCGYLVLYQAPTGGPFQVMREENNFMDNAAAADIAEKGSLAEVEKTWANMSAHCPGYKRSPATNLAPLPESTSSTIGYPTVAAALAGLQAKPGVVFTNQGGWTVASDDADKAIWSFPPQGHPAYPAAVKRQLIDDGKGTSMQMHVHCQASKEACDNLVRTFEQLNAEMAASLRSH